MVVNGGLRVKLRVSGWGLLKYLISVSVKSWRLVGWLK